MRRHHQTARDTVQHDADLPVPEPAALAASAALAERIREAIAAAGGWIDFARYMELALYEPGLGYYSGGGTKLGPAGDFVTAPELGDFLAAALAQSLLAELAGAKRRVVLELGAGTGALGEQLQDAFAAAGAPLDAYLILEPSASLRARQAERLARFGERVSWLDRLPAEPIEAAIVANEVVDALPASCFVKSGGRALPLGVEAAEPGFRWALGTVDRALEAEVRGIEDALGYPLPDGYRSEVRPVLPAWIAALGASLTRGSITLIDYGLTRREYYHPQRSSGTLLCHYRHRAHDDPFLYPGLQDIGVWVDFSACAAAAVAAGLEVAGFTTQAQFLLAHLPTTAFEPSGGAAELARLAALKTLLLPGEMGERFKLLRLTKGIEATPLGGRDLRSRL